MAFKKRLFFILLSFLMPNLSFGQADPAKIIAIKNHVEFVEILTSPINASKINAITSDKHFSTTVDSGPLFGTISRGIFKKKQALGTWSTYITSDIESKTIYAVIVNFYSKSHVVKKFFYEKNKLVFAEIQSRDKNDSSNSFYKSTEFYFNDSLILKEETPVINLVSTDFPGIKVDLQKDGNFYLKRALEKVPFKDR